jgi:hypothetical protein
LLGVGTSPYSSTLDLDALNGVRKEFSISEKELMVVSSTIFLPCQSLEAIEVELAL